MKRSQMITTIAIAMNSGYGRSFVDLELPAQIMDKQVAAFILQSMEQAGILPPVSGEEHATTESGSGYYRDVHEWEISYCTACGIKLSNDKVICDKCYEEH